MACMMNVRVKMSQFKKLFCTLHNLSISLSLSLSLCVSPHDRLTSPHITGILLRTVGFSNFPTNSRTYRYFCTIMFTIYIYCIYYLPLDIFCFQDMLFILLMLLSAYFGTFFNLSQRGEQQFSTQINQ